MGIGAVSADDFAREGHYSYYRLQLLQITVSKMRNDKATMTCKEYFILYIYI